MMVVDITNVRGVYQMAMYVDGFVLVVPKGKAEEYRKMAEEGRDSWMKHGALQYFECKGNDLKPHEMVSDTSRSFIEMTGANSDDDVWFSFIVFESKAHRDEVNKKVMAEMDETYADQSDFISPFAMNQLSYGGFEVVVEAQKA
jgi:uncharacterized protein YbaA (DUF1428 family)